MGARGGRRHGGDAVRRNGDLRGWAVGRRYKRMIGNCERRAGAACGAYQVPAAFCVFVAPVW